MGAKNGEQISRDFYAQNMPNWQGELGQEATKETARGLGEAAIFSPVETPKAEVQQVMESPVFDEMMARPQTPEFGKIETINSVVQNDLSNNEAGFANYTKEFSNADGKIVQAEIENLEFNPFAGYEALQKDRAEYLKAKFNRDF